MQLRTIKVLTLEREDTETKSDPATGLRKAKVDGHNNNHFRERKIK